MGNWVAGLEVSQPAMDAGRSEVMVRRGSRINGD